MASAANLQVVNHGDVHVHGPIYLGNHPDVSVQPEEA